MDNSYCCVPKCNSLGSHRPRTSFHRFPRIKDESSRRRHEEWIRVLRIGKKVTSRMVVCGKHFQPSDFLPRGKINQIYLCDLIVSSNAWDVECKRINYIAPNFQFGRTPCYSTTE